MSSAALRISLLAHLLLLAGCSMHAAVKAPVAPDALDDAKSWVYVIQQALPNYEADPISRFEQPEILNVERDIASVADETDQLLFTEEVNLLKDWGILVALDNVMQQEGVI